MFDTQYHLSQSEKFGDQYCPRLGERSEMGELAELRRWDELIPDALGLIFRDVSLQEKLTVVPRVCKAWEKAVAGPYCWQEIDIKEWSKSTKPEKLDRMLQMLVVRSCGNFYRLSVSGLANEAVFTFMAEHASSLQTLELPRCELSNPIIEQVAPRLANITYLDVSCCQKLGAPALEALGKHCKSLVVLRRTMHPLEVADKVSQDDEAYAIAATMAKLKRLELSYCLVTTGGVLKILAGCKDLEVLDIRGCWEARLEEDVLKKQYGGVEVLGPDIDDSYERSYWGEDDCSDYSDSSVYSWEYMEDDGVWDDEQELEGLEVRFYGGGFNDPAVGHEWPSSP